MGVEYCRYYQLAPGGGGWDKHALLASMLLTEGRPVIYMGSVRVVLLTQFALCGCSPCCCCVCQQAVATEQRHPHRLVMFGVVAGCLVEGWYMRLPLFVMWQQLISTFVMSACVVRSL